MRSRQQHDTTRLDTRQLQGRARRSTHTHTHHAHHLGGGVRGQEQSTGHRNTLRSIRSSSSSSDSDSDSDSSAPARSDQQDQPVGTQVVVALGADLDSGWYHWAVAEAAAEGQACR